MAISRHFLPLYLVAVLRGGRKVFYEVYARNDDEAKAKTSVKGEVLWVTSNVVHLQSWGKSPAIKGDDIQVGDVFRFNFGGTARVLEVVSETKAFRTFAIEENGKRFERRYKRTSLVPVTDETFELRTFGKVFEAEAVKHA